MSRPNLLSKWGVPVPDDENGHVVYVWFDALLNYITGLRLHQQAGGSTGDFRTTHIIGKDILWFHAVVWIAMLRALGGRNVTLPAQIAVHGHILTA